LIDAWNNEHEAALARFDRLLTLEPGNLEARVDRARVLAWRGDLEDAISVLERVLAGHPDYAPALEAKAQFLSWSGEYSAALSSYDRLVGISQDPTGIMLARARVLGWASRIGESLAVYDSILARTPQDLEARLGQARLLAFSAQTGEAVARYEGILADHPRNLEARQGLARALTWGGGLPRGERAWRSALEAAPRDMVSRVGLAQNLQWQGRHAAALAVLKGAEPDQREDPRVVEQLRLVRAALAPQVELSLIQEGDSDDNLMTTVQMTGGWNPVPHLAVRGEAYTRALEQSSLDLTRNSWGASLRALYQLEPGWTIDGRVGGTRSDGSEKNAFTHLSAGIASPGRYGLGGQLNLSRYPLDATAPLVERGVRVDMAEISGRWTPSPGWQVSGSAGLGTFHGNEENRRVHGNARVDHRLGGGWTVGLSHRYFGFDENLNEFYFDPDYYGLTELTGRWKWEPDGWSLLLEAAPGVQKIRSEGALVAAVRASSRVIYRFAPGREVSVSGGYSSAGLQSFSTEDSDYRYRAVILGVKWAF
jgi:tetratricopeptide (TPR) repeat protein